MPAAPSRFTVVDRIRWITNFSALGRLFPPRLTPDQMNQQAAPTIVHMGSLQNENTKSARLHHSFRVRCWDCLAQSGLSTAEQARRGETAYNKNCATCHGSELRPGDREVTPLTDKAFKAGWVGKTVAEKFEATRNTMPPERNSLGDQVYLDIIAYILQFNKVPAGGQELKPDLSVLQQIVIPAPPE